MTHRRSSLASLGLAPLGVALAVALAVMPACVDDPTIDRADRAILGGQAATTAQFPSVVAILLDHGGALCTGTLVAPSWVLTAAHCVDPAENGVSTQADVTQGLTVLVGTIDAQGGGRSIAAIDSVHSPEFHQPGDPDLGLIHLATAVTDVPPSPINFDAAAAPVGMAITMVGFGVADSGSAGREFFLTDKVSETCAGAGVSDAQFLCFNQQDGRGQCNGDSGGPSFAKIGGVQKIVAVTSFGDQNCQAFGADMRTDAGHAFIVQQAPELDCQGDGACNQACGRGALPADPDCPVCKVDGDCGSADLACDGGRCVPAPFTPGGMGADCSAGQPACVVGKCGASGQDHLCTDSCDPAGAACPDGFDCVAAGSDHVCWPSPASGGCQAGGNAQLGGGLATLALAALLRRRRRRSVG